MNPDAFSFEADTITVPEQPSEEALRANVRRDLLGKIRTIALFEHSNREDARHLAEAYRFLTLEGD